VLATGALENDFVRLEPLGLGHVGALVAAAQEDPGLYGLAPVPGDAAGMHAYVRAALADADASRAVPYAIVRKGADRSAGGHRVVGSVRFMSLEWWTWPDRPSFPLRVAGEPRQAQAGHPPDVVEIGHAWLAASAVRTAANSGACLLMLAHAFEVWRVHRVTLKTDARNARSRAAIDRIGARFEGVLRSHLPAADGIIRDTAMYSLLPGEWPETKQRLESALARAQNGER
jgi:RimJ/RimL family protein N-acetyltransferase